MAVTFGLGPLQERCIAFIEAHSQVQLPISLQPHTLLLLLPDPLLGPQEALRTRGFLELSAPALLPLLRSDKLCVDEADLVLAARSWARVGAVSGAEGSAGWGCRRIGLPEPGAGGGPGAPRPPPPRAQGWCSQAVLERPVAEVAAPVVRELRLALLAPAELSALEEQNRREPLIPVRGRGTWLRATRQRGGGGGGGGHRVGG